MTTRKAIVGRNERISFEDEEIDFLAVLVDNEINKNQKFDRDRMYFLLKLRKKFDVGDKNGKISIQG
jgi:hypothetical protein